MRNVAMTLCFNRPAQVEKALKRFRDTNKDWKSFEYVLVDLKYPLPNEMENSYKLVDLAYVYGATLLRPKENRGVSHNWMWTMYEMGLRPGDFLIGMDPDSEPVQDGWAQAIVDVLLDDPKIGYCGLTCISPPGLETEVDESNRKYQLVPKGGHMVRVYETLIAWPMGGFSVEFMLRHGLHQSSNQYGWIEHETDKVMRQNGYDWVMLDQFHDQTSDRGEPEYQQWKIEQARHETKLDFKTWLEQRGCI